MRLLQILAAALLLPLCSSAFAQDCDGWVGIGDPGARVEHTIAYDSARQVTVLFGGVMDPVDDHGMDYAADTWEFDGSRWYFRSLSGPSPRAYHAMAYDSDRHVMVLFGGLTYAPGTTVALNDTWEWDGTTWTQRTPGGDVPPIRYGHVMSYDPVHHVTLLFGGSGVNSNSLWTYDGNNWTLVPIAGTWPLYSATTTPSMAWNPVTQRTILISNGTFAWDGTHWTGLTLAPLSGVKTTLAFDPRRGAMIATSRAPNVSPIYQLNQNWTQTNDYPVQSNAGVIAVHEASGQVFLFGGPGYSTNQLVYQWDIPQQSGVPLQPRTGTPAPPGAYDASMAFDSARGVSVAFGGLSPLLQITYGETWELRGETWTKRNIPGFNQPSSRYAAGMAYDPTRGVCTLVGGSFGDLNTWDWNGHTWTSHHAGGPTTANTYGVQMMWDEGNQRLFQYSRPGTSAIYQAGQWITQTVTGETDSYLAACYEPVRNSILAAAGASMQYTYSFNGTQLTPLIAQNQTASWRPMMAYDPEREAVILTGGFRPPANDQTQQVNFPAATYSLGSTATSWTRVQTPTPHGRKFATLVYEPLAQRLVMWGGSNHSANFRETWKFARGPAAVAAPPARAYTRPGSSASFNIVARGGGTIHYQWRRGTTDLHNSTHIQGADTDTLTILNAGPADLGLYSCAVSNPCGQDTSPTAALTLACAADYNNDGDTGTDADIDAFFACLSGTCCLTCGSADFNGDGDVGTDQDIESFFRVLAGGSC